MTKTQNPLKIATPPKNNLAKYKTKLDSVKNGQDRESSARRRVPPQASPSTKKFRCSATHPHFLVLGRPARFSPARPHSRLQSRLLSLHGQQRRGDCSGLAGGGRCERSAFSLPVFGLRRRRRRCILGFVVLAVPVNTHREISPVVHRRRVYLSPVRQHQVRANATGSDKLNRKRAVWRGSTSEFISAYRGFESRPCSCIRSPPHRSQAPLSPRPAHFAYISTTVFYSWGTALVLVTIKPGSPR